MLGAGPFTRGTIYNGWRFAGSRVDLPLDTGGRPQDRPEIATFHTEQMFHSELLEEEPLVAEQPAEESDVVPASAEVPAE